MANLKEIRDRIVSVKNTRKITEAMRLVAAAKVRRAQDQVLKSRPFADKLARVLENIQSRVQFEAVDSPLLSKREVKNITLVCITADRGLCGGYNTNIIKKVEIRYSELVKQGYQPNLILVGKKAIGYFQNRKDRYVIKCTFKELEQVPTVKDSEGVTNEILAEFLSENSDRVEIIYTKFITLVSCAPVVQTLLPLDPQGIAEENDEIFRLTTKDSKLLVEKSNIEKSDSEKLPSDIVFEQSPDQLLDSLLPLYLQNQVLRALQESAASELACRMTAMNNASDNAKELASTLNLTYNKARQAAITQEILEVVGGSAV
ncbi:F0F1 ATP synthase subunit gamma [Prochlorococcus sp. AH-736-A21]|nr:F0F1 ATP synthase subunit gamma [Prochlorococcus sp. AH-736-A21]